ncbi:MAG TPA: 7TM-DISM domain-containing protein [Cyclobacteriaceae bacterium]|nr:7TM-DISM domain-containing protein [Cyclobacteriaceae bacterium]
MSLRVLFLFIALLVAARASSQTTPKPGVIDASSFDFKKGRLNLTGTWLWYDGRLIQPGPTENFDLLPVEFPGVWNERRVSESGQGVATYFLTVILPPRSEDVAVDLPDIYSSYILFANGVEAARNGTPGTSRQTTLPQWRPQIATITTPGDTLQLTLQIANFNHNKGGCKEPILLGLSSAFAQKDLISKTGKLTGIGMLVVLAIIFLAIFFRNGRKRVVIYFSLLCLTWAIRSLFSNDYLFINFFPDFSWNAMIRIEYITLYLTMIWAILFLYRLFKHEGNQVVKYLLVTFNAGFVVYTMLTEPVEFTRLLPLYLATAGVLLVYGAGVVLVALVNERRGATWLTMSVLLGLGIFSYDLFAYEGWFSYNALLFSAGYLIIFLLTGGALLLHLEIIRSARTTTAILTYKDLYGESEKS